MKVSRPNSLVFADKSSSLEKLVPNATSINEALPQILQMLLAVQASIQSINDRLAGTHKNYYAVEEIASMTSRSPYTIRRWIKSGRIRAERVSGTGPRGRLLISHDELQKLVELGRGCGVPDIEL